ncbi:tail fiber domain-containing protein [Ekhidna sp.]|uniref:tail fiber domain-containing protein n=1 Tax=Ekhidna sp. TaxID=2608089 RepID=UPI003BAACF6F
MKKIASIILIFYAAFGLAQVPETMHFQGYLADPGTGDAVTDGNYSLTFTIYDASSAGNNLWTESHSVVSVTDGYFSVILGTEGSPLALAFDTQYYLEVQVGAETLSPRYTLSSSAYALNARNIYSATNGYVGIGTNAPDASLHIQGNDTGDAIFEEFRDDNQVSLDLRKARGTSATPGALLTGDSLGNIDFMGHDGTNFQVGARIGTSAATDFSTSPETNMAFYTYGPSTFGETDQDLYERVTINRYGNLGVGTSTPASEFDIIGTDAAGGVLARIQNTDGTGWSGFVLRNDLGDAFSISMGGSTASNAPGKFYIFNGYTSTSSLVINELGNVGIGTESPSTELEVEGTGQTELKIDAGTNAYLVLDANGNLDISGTIFQKDGSTRGSIRYDHSTGGTDDNLLMIVDNAEALRIQASGNVGVGRTPTANLLEVEGAASKTSAGDWLANSDRRIKTAISDIDNSIALIKKLRPVKFKYTEQWKAEHPSIKDKYYYNFIAQEYEKVFPESVQGSGEYLDGDSQEILQIDTYNAQIVTIQAVKDLIAKVEALEKENASLISDNQKLSAELADLKSSLSRIEKALGITSENKVNNLGSED